MTADPIARAIALGTMYEPLTVALAGRAWPWLYRRWRRPSTPRGPQSAQELIVYARSLERTMPGLASELQCMALRWPDAET